MEAFFKEILSYLPPGLQIIFAGLLFWAWYSFKKSNNAFNGNDLSALITDFKDDIREMKEDINRFKEEMKEITKDGIKAGVDSRKEQWKEINSLKTDITFVEGYLTKANGFKKEK